MPPKVQKTKAQKLLAAQASSRAGKSKKKWAKSKMREKKNNRVSLSAEALDQITKGAVKRKALTYYSLIEAYKINGSVARQVVRDLLAAGSIKVVSKCGNMSVFTGSSE